MGSLILSSKSIRPRPSFVPTFLVHFRVRAPFTNSTRSFQRHKNTALPPIPQPTPFVPDVQTFLNLIGRGLSQHVPKISTWTQLFTISSKQLRELGVEPPRNRRYLLSWLQKFREGRFGFGGDLKYIKDGSAELRVVEVPAVGQRPATATQSPNSRKIVVNVDPESDLLKAPIESLVPVKGLRVRGAHTILGPHVLPIAGGKGGKIVIKDGLWEIKRGHKVDGGERRQAEVRAKRRAEEKKKALERKLAEESKMAEEKMKAKN